MIGLVAAHTLVIFIGGPVVAAAILATLVYASTIADGPRYRPGLPWFSDPVWLNGPSEPEQADSAVQPAPARPELPAGVTSQAEPATSTSAPATVPARPVGGASARW